MSNAIFISIKPIHVNRIIEGLKEFEYRNYIPKKGFDTIFVYTTIPVAKLQYILKIDYVVEYTEKITIESHNVEEFNNGKLTKYAYHISEIHELDTPIDLKKLKRDFLFPPPQAYAYDEKYNNLTKYIKKANKKRLR